MDAKTAVKMLKVFFVKTPPMVYEIRNLIKKK